MLFMASPLSNIAVYGNSIDEEGKSEQVNSSGSIDSEEVSADKEGTEADASEKEDQQKEAVNSQSEEEREETSEQSEDSEQKNESDEEADSFSMSVASTSREYKRGDVGQEILDFKVMLAKIGFGVSSNPTYTYGPSTEATVREFQDYFGLTVTGVADEATIQKVEASYNSPYQRGNMSGEIRDLKLDLNKLGFSVSNNPTFTFGPTTEEEVKNFQRHYGLVVNGIIDEVTLAKINELKESLDGALTPGSNNQAVYEMKLKLNKIGFFITENPNANYGPQTEAAVKAFQEYFGLSVTGTADEATLEKIEATYNSPYQRGNMSGEIRDLKLDLNKLGFSVSNNPTFTFGPTTEEEVKNFQRHYGLVVNGIIDEVTLAKINKLKESLGGALIPGSNNQAVYEMKLRLNKIGFFITENPNANYGSQTEAAVKAFQEYFGLSATGTADEATLEKIEATYNSPYQRGNMSGEIRDLKLDLNKLGFSVSNNPTFTFGPTTEEEVKNFQRHYGLVVNGIIDEVTLAKISELLAAPLEPGLYRRDVYEMKLKLNELGFLGVKNPDYNYGPQTEAAVKAFQEYFGLSVTGIADDQTIETLDYELNNALRRGQSHNGVGDLKSSLNQIGFSVSMDYPNDYGPGTEATVKAFQEYYGLRNSGIADTITLDMLNSIVNSPFRLGQSDGDVHQLKAQLNKLGFPVGMNYPNNYGPDTEKHVKDFQNHYGLVVNGIADPVTLNRIEELLNSPLQNGKSHSSLPQYKEMLNVLGYDGLSVNNDYFGDNTERRVKEYQKDNHLPVSGILDQITIDVLTNAYNSNSIKIFIDPGHGGTDPGGIGFGLKEKDLALDISLSAASYLEERYQFVDVRLSRTTDTTLALKERSQMANAWEADYFVSVHTNAHNGQARGFESFIFNGNVSSTTVRHQENIHSYIIGEMGVHDRGMKRADFSVLRNTNMPAILLEFLFIDNQADNELLRDRAYREWLGVITAEAIAESFNLQRK
ncbi:peptidoglycan-binding protein [Amphibacillus jilinensis]|uniref:peptidoglycan-binding protein n=1 Tax=Amphibacillus jilinensis TaxID=1216008 RepID=UPI000316E8CE|nr:peptidoglycan-binding protein [Amphibacillus jilinensis]